MIGHILPLMIEVKKVAKEFLNETGSEQKGQGKTRKIYMKRKKKTFFLFLDIFVCFLPRKSCIIPAPPDRSV